MSGQGQIAIVGLDCRFPGAPDPQAFWQLLMDGTDSTSYVPEGRWDAPEFYAQSQTTGRSNTLRGGFIDQADAFDNDFFGISPREAGAMDPQQRLLLETSWRALEDAGVAPQNLAGSDCGVFVGVMGNEWAFLHMEGYDGITAQLGSGNGYFMCANRVSYHLDLKGPSLAVDTACSSSLVAVHLAANALLSGECGYALAGGVNLILTPALNIFYTQAGLSSPDGRCRPFSAGANGIGRAEGVGMVVLRRLEDALADRQPVYAVLAGTAVNQDGRSNGITAPSRWAQQEVISAARRRAGVTAGDIRFVEGHGTGTLLGDMIEARALGHVNTERTSGSCAIGSVKGNFGHAEGAAGIAGVIKTALALQHRTVPPSPFAKEENPKLNLAEKGLSLLKAPLRLGSGITHAGVSSFGIGGTNAHVVMASAPRAVRRPVAGAPAVFTVSADSPEGLRRNLLAQAETLGKQAQDSFGQLSWTSNQVKSRLPYRAAVAAADLRTLIPAMREAAEQAQYAQPPVRRGTPSVAFLFTGQGSQYPKMTAQWYRSSPVYARLLDEADKALCPWLDGSVREAILDGDEGVHRTGLAQPALFAVEYAMAATLVEAGIRPSMLLGHSVGEFAAAVVGGVLQLDDAARLVARRGQLMDGLADGGGMAAVELTAAEAGGLLADRPGVDLAAVNGERSVVVSGGLRELDALGAELAERSVRFKRLPVSHAFHSELMRPMVEEFRSEASRVPVEPSGLPVFSTLRGRRLADDELMDADYWAEQVTAPVRFHDAASALLAERVTHVVEIGPRGTLLQLLTPLVPEGRTVSGHAAHPGPQAAPHRLPELLGELYCAGLDPDWDMLYDAANRVPRRLAPYAFDDRGRYWHTLPPRPGGTPADRAVPAAADASGGLPGESAVPADADGATADAPAGEAMADLVRRIVCQVSGHSPARVRDDARLPEDLGLDSITAIELKTRIERALPFLGILPVAELLASLQTVGDLIGYLHQRAAKRGEPTDSAQAGSGLPGSDPRP